MATITFKGNAIETVGELPGVGQSAPDFLLTNTDLADVSLADFADCFKILNITPSLDTGVCVASAVAFNKQVAQLPDVKLLNISADLPFAAGRVCGEKNLDNIVPLSTFRAPAFGEDYGLRIVGGPFAGLLARAVLVLDKNNQIVHAQLVPEIAQEPDYDAALAAVPAAN